MVKRMWLILLLSTLFASLALASCTRAKPEAVTPTAVSPLSAATSVTPAFATLTALAPLATPTVTFTPVITPAEPPTSIPLTPGPTTISVSEDTPTLVPAATPAGGSPTPTTPSGTAEYTVQWGDTLFSIARRFNTTVEALVALNGLADPGRISVGQVLIVSGTGVPSPGTGSEYVVRAGDTLSSIAQRYNTTVEAIRRANGLASSWYIRVGQRLIIPQSGTEVPVPGGTAYTVQPGDTLYSIAARYGKNVSDIISANQLTEPYWIFVGQVLTIP